MRFGLVFLVGLVITSFSVLYTVVTLFGGCFGLRRPRGARVVLMVLGSRRKRYSKRR